MSLVAGTRLGPYEIQAAIGAGGMGEVYRARDTRLDRTVAIKVLPTELSTDPDRRARFEWEARAVAALNHPHICTLHDVGEHDGSTFLVMEHLQGETLADRLLRGRLPLEEALTTATDIAGALAAAHRQGIVHRDLKPGNVMLTKVGAKLLDFGLAKLRPAGGLENLGATALPTVQPMTVQGIVVGTVPYMAPEQLEGKDADARSDIFSFGAVLAEMLSGRRAFEGSSAASIVAAVLDREPAGTDVIQSPDLQALILRCLAKDPENRWQAIADVFFQLRLLSENPDVLGTHAESGAQAGGGGRALRFQIPLPRHSLLTPLGSFGAGFQVAVSPDGRRIAFVAGGERGESLIWVRDVDQFEARPLPGTEGASRGLPFWSPDSKHLGFFGQGHLYRIEARGGPRQALCEADGRGGTWNRDGVILFAPRPNTGLHVVPASGGSPAVVTVLNASAGETSHRFPHFLPDGRNFLFFAFADAEHQGVYLGSLDGREPRHVLRCDSNAVYAPPGELLWVRGGTLLAQPFDVRELTVRAEPRPLADGVGQHLGFGQSSVSASYEGTLVYASGQLSCNELVWVRRDGTRVEAVAAEPASYSSIALSPLGDVLAVEKMDPHTATCDIWLLEVPGGLATRFTSGRYSQRFPVWSPDGKHLAFWVDTGGRADLYVKTVGDEVEEEKLLRSMPGNMLPTDWSPDGRFIISHAEAGGTVMGLWLVPTEGGQEAPLHSTRFNNVQGQLSPDGRWLAYVSDESETFEVYVREFQRGGGKARVSHHGGSQPRWSRDGSELFYVAPDGMLMTVSVEREATRPRPATPKPLFRTGLPPLTFPFPTNYAVAPDGQRFVLNNEVREPGAHPINVVCNWFATLAE